jgi:hypothetical protein
MFIHSVTATCRATVILTFGLMTSKSIEVNNIPIKSYKLRLILSDKDFKQLS